MSNTTRANDWEFCALGSISGSLGAGGTLFGFWFKSKRAGVDEFVTYTGVTGGVSGGVLPIAIPLQRIADRAGRWGHHYLRLSPHRSFSLTDLNGTLGTFAVLGGGVVAGYQSVRMTAGNLFDHTERTFVFRINFTATLAQGYWSVNGVTRIGSTRPPRGTVA